MMQDQHGPVEAFVYVPAPGSQLEKYLAPKSAVVGRQHGDLLHVYYEGNIYGAENLKDWHERVRCAAGRLFCRYPTVAQQAVRDASSVIAVGVVRGAHPRASYEIDIFDGQQAVIDTWLAD